MDESLPELEAADDHDLGSLVALASLPALGPNALWALLAFDTPSLLWQRVRTGRIPRVAPRADHRDRWAQAARQLDPAQLLARHRAADIVVFPELTLTGYPPEDLLFHAGLRKRVEAAVEDAMAQPLPDPSGEIDEVYA